ncbi:hypothetical protein GFL38_32695 [Rhizobium leguminosarum bv. viciae]|uniref:hypothetical protein n=1 Tax=Rhizobium ruizarguesonis TaxID=2081791 RepID=UPI00143F5712|nr:hypothetical protein [Rhizobium ruizarguesonis]NKJ76932.1 hypothetical protein [Rhizobium leguminosarum bv. viciae]NKQ74945.1 hypothetical protein [Rhizobium ruizarguesonis]NKQ82030.1 hypothetical protein [Rhizobium ruizarguesonis]
MLDPVLPCGFSSSFEAGVLTRKHSGRDYDGNDKAVRKSAGSSTEASIHIGFEIRGRSREAEKLYAIVSNFLARRHLGNPVEVNFLNIGAFQCVMVAGLGYPARSFADAEELEEALNSYRDDVPKTTIPAP